MTEILELRPLRALFPRMEATDFHDMRAFSCRRRDGLCLADFTASDYASNYWEFSIFDIPSSHHLESRRPIASNAVSLVLEHFGGLGNWLLTPSQKSFPQAPQLPKKTDHIRREQEIVYFLSAGDFIKIGKATGDPKYRMAALKTGCPFPISIIAYMHGGLAEETELHKRFSTLRAHGEWFHAAPELLAFIESIGGRS